MGMHEHCRFEEKIELLQATGVRVSDRHALDASEDVLNGGVSRSGSEDNFVRIIKTKTYDVSILQCATIDLASAYVDPAAVASVFEVPTVTLGNKCSAHAGHAPDL